MLGEGGKLRLACGQSSFTCAGCLGQLGSGLLSSLIGSTLFPAHAVFSLFAPESKGKVVLTWKLASGIWKLPRQFHQPFT